MKGTLFLMTSHIFFNKIIKFLTAGTERQPRRYGGILFKV
jgi:hypothetical protein